MLQQFQKLYPQLTGSLPQIKKKIVYVYFSRLLNLLRPNFKKILENYKYVYPQY